jgi:hypothetical protein
MGNLVTEDTRIAAHGDMTGLPVSDVLTPFALKA